MSELKRQQTTDLNMHPSSSTNTGEKKPRVSVIIPLYNKATFISRTIGSVLNQTMHDFELIIVDDGSRDGGDEIAATFTSDSRVKVLRRSNGGQSAARNTGIAAANSDLIALLDADDEWRPEFLSAILEMYESYPEAGLYATGYQVAYPSGAIGERTIESATGRTKTSTLMNDYFRKAQAGSIIFPSVAAIPARVFDKIGTFIEGAHRGGDREMWARAALYYPIAYDWRILAIYHADATGRENTRRDRKLQPPPFSHTARLALERGELSAELIPDIRAYVDRLWLDYARTCIREGQRLELLRVLNQELSDNLSHRSEILRLRLATRLLPLPVLEALLRIGSSRWGARVRRKPNTFGVVARLTSRH